MSMDLDELVIRRARRIPLPDGVAGDGSMATRQFDAVLTWWGSDFSALRALVDAIEESGAVDPLWDTALRVLDDFAAGTGAPKKHRTFWKRG